MGKNVEEPQKRWYTLLINHSRHEKNLEFSELNSYNSFFGLIPVFSIFENLPNDWFLIILNLSTW